MTIIRRQRRANQLRPIRIHRRFIETAHGSCLIEMGRTRVLCTACILPEVPPWRKESGLGWLTAEYSMLPASTSPRKSRPKQGHTDSRGSEIQRLIGRVLRSVIDFEKLGPNTICLDCDVLQADGGTRTAAINGSYIALMDAVRSARKSGILKASPLTGSVAAVSVGIVEGKPRLDLDYELDSRAEVDMNIAMTGDGRFVEIQGTGENTAFDGRELQKMLNLARKGIRQILAAQKKALR